MTRRVTAAVYDAAVGARAWTEVSSILRDAFHLEMATIEIIDLKTGDVRTSAHQLSDDAQREYEERIFHINPRVHVPNLQPLKVYGDRHHAEHALTGPEYYDWARLHGLSRYASGGAVMYDADFFAVAAMLKSAGQGRPTDEQEAAWERLLPTIAQALQIERTLAARNHTVDLVAIEHLNSGQAYALIDEAGLIVEATDQFRCVAKSSGALSLRGGVLLGLWPTDRAKVAALIASVRSGRSAKAIRLGRPAGGHGTVLRGVPLFRAREHFARLRPAGLLTLVDLDAPIMTQLDNLRALWNLTPREAAVAVCVANGRTLEETAAQLGIGTGTVKHHLKSVFQRMEVDRQADVVRLVRQIGG